MGKRGCGGIWTVCKEVCGRNQKGVDGGGEAVPEETLMSRGRRPSCTSAPRKTGEESEFRGRVKGSGPV